MEDKAKKVKTKSDRASRKTGSTKLWKAVSQDSPEVLWVRGRTKPDIKKHLRHFLRSTEYWEGEPEEDIARDIFKSYSENIKDCPGLRVDDTRGDVLINLTDPSLDWIDRDDNNKAKEGSKEEKEKTG